MREQVGCVDCNAVMTGRYCADCGARTPSRPITVGSLFHDLVHGTLHADKGVLFTFRQLLRHPGQTPRRHIEGRTARLTMPFHYLILCCAFAAALGWLANHAPPVASSAPHVHAAVTTNSYRVGQYIAALSRWAWLLLLVVSASVGTVVFRNNRLSYAEHLAFAAYTFGQMIVLAAFAYAVTSWARRAGAALPLDGLDAGMLAASAWYLVAATAFYRGRALYRAAGAVATLLVSLVVFRAALGAAVAGALAVGVVH